MKLSEVAQVASNLAKQKDFHKEQCTYFLKLFNLHAKEIEPQPEIVGPGDLRLFLDSLSYSPIMKFYQKQAEHHASECFKIDLYADEFQQAAEAKLLAL